MKIDVKRLRLKGKTETSFSFEYEAEDDIITLPYSSFSRPVEVTGNLFYDGDKVFVDGVIRYSVSTVCSRCFRAVEFENEAEFSETFSDSSDADDYPLVNEIVDLDGPVRDNLILSFPYAVYCREDCKGLCPKCGKNLNDGQCDCSKQCD